MTAINVENGRVLLGDEIAAGARLTLADGRIAGIETGDGGAKPGDLRIDLAGGWLLPGFVDTQVNGGGGVLFGDAPTVDGIAAIGAAHARFGTTGFLPTLISATPDVIAAGLDAVDAAIDAGVPGVIGIHVEGPFISLARKGIHAERNIRALQPSMVELLCQPRRGVVMLTIAPEEVESADLERLSAAGVVLSAGHTDATYEEAAGAFSAGVRGVTHLFNAMSPFTHRAPGMVGAALDDENVWCGLIVDGIHVAAPALRLAFAAKGSDRIMLVTDAMSSVGMGDGSFTFNDQEIAVSDGMCIDPHGTLAGSNLDMAAAVRNMMSLAGADIVAASRMASATPAAFLGLSQERGVLAPGQRADFVVLDAAMQPVETWIGGVRTGE